MEAVALRHRPHGHVSAIAPARDAHALVIHRKILHDPVYPRHNVAEIAIPEVLHVAPRECLALTVAPPRVGIEHEIPHAGKQRSVEESLRPARYVRPRRPAVYVHHQSVAPAAV